MPINHHFCDSMDSQPLRLDYDEVIIRRFKLVRKPNVAIINRSQLQVEF